MLEAAIQEEVMRLLYCKPRLEARRLPSASSFVCRALVFVPTTSLGNKVDMSRSFRAAASLSTP